ncbi:MAG: hypothetical protein L0Y50_05150 [Beijerinckiaceae bacterium]|nr:hypothetical protein [Beijerinckiaceae bacterium]
MPVLASEDSLGFADPVASDAADLPPCDIQESGPPLNRQEAAALLAAVAKLLRFDSTSREHFLADRAKLARKLDELDLTILEAGTGGQQPFKAALAELLAELQALRRIPLVAGSPCQKATPDSAGEAHAAAPAPESENTGAGKASAQEQSDRITRELYRSLTQLQAARSRPPRMKARAAASFLGAAPALTAVQDGHDALLRQVDTAHQRLAERLEAGFAAAAEEAGALRSAISGAVKEIESACGPAGSALAATGLGADFSKLAQCFDGGHASLAAIERSISHISDRLEETHRLISGVSKTAKPDAANSLLSHEAAQSILREIAGLRDQHEETARSTALTLRAIKDSLDQVANRCARLEAATKDGALDYSGTGVDASDPFVPIFKRLTQQAEDNTLAIRARADGSAIALPGAALGEGIPDARGTAGPEDSVRSGTAHAAGFLIEPGLGFPGRVAAGDADGQGAPRAALRDREEGSSRTDFIAAARRAARTAQMELRGTAPAAPKGDAFRGETAASLLGRGRDFIGARKLTLVLAAAVLLASLGALVLARPLAHGRFIDLLPGFLRQLHDGAGDGKPARLGGTPAQGAMNKAAAGKPFAPASPPGNRTQGEDSPPPPGPTASGVRPAAAAETLAPPGPPFSAAVARARSMPAPRAIAGSDAIVAATMQPGQPANISAPGRRPSRAATAVPPAPPAGMPASASGGAAVISPAPPAAWLDKGLAARAEAGGAAAQFEIAARYAEGGAGTANLALAAKWYEKAAQQGHAAAAYRLASLYEQGRGVAKSIERAKELYQRAAEKGNIRAMHNLGVLAADGADGRPNYTSAALWFGKAAEYGIPDSQYNLAVLLARGLGVTMDLVQSYTWFAIVAAGGDAEAARKRDEVAARLTASEAAAANAAVAAFAPRPADRLVNESEPPPVGREAAPAQAEPVKPKVSGL